MSTEENKALVRQWYDTHHPERLDQGEALLTEDFQAHMPGVPGPLGRDVFKQVGSMFFTAFSDIEQTFEDQVAAGDRVASRGIWRGTHTGDFQGIPATGRRVTTNGMGIDRVAGGKIAEHWAQLDLVGVLQQLGAIPESAQAGG